MIIVKIIMYANWAVIGILVALTVFQTIFPAKGGEAAGRGLSQAFYYLAIIVLVVMTILNLLPFDWAKFVAFGIVVLPLAYLQTRSLRGKIKRKISAIKENAKPIFPDPERDQIARAIRNGQPEKLQQLLQIPLPNLNEGGELLRFAVMEACSSSFKPQEKTDCVRHLFAAGASLEKANPLENPLHLNVAAAGNAALLRLLLEQGAKPNARHFHNTHFIIFKAVDAYQDPEASVRVLLEFGADPNVESQFDPGKGKVSPLYRAAELCRWGVCAALVEYGAKLDTTAKDGSTFKSLFETSYREFYADGYSKREDFERLKALLPKDFLQ